MRSRPTLSLAVFLPALAAIAAPAATLAQDNASGSNPAPILSLPRPSSQSAQPQRQGPELDVFRDTTPLSQQPVTPPPPVTTTRTPPPATTPASPAPPAVDRAPATTRRPEPARPAASAVAPTREASGASAPATPDNAAPSATEGAVPPVGNDAVAPVREAAPTAPAEAPPTPAAQPGDTPWGWIAAALALVAITAMAFLLRRRPAREENEPAQEAAPSPAPPPPSPPPPSPTPPSPTPPRAAPPPPPPSQSPAARPWLEIDLAVDSARHGDAGLSIGYRIALRNRGDAPANDILVHALLGHADANQNDVLRAFYSGRAGQPVHSVVEIAAGATYVLDGELHLPPHLVEPVELDGRLLLVPLVAFDVHYRWSAGTSTGVGRSGSAFIIGREQTPPSPRLAPFRYDLGPGDHGGAKVGCRRTALSLAS